MARYRSILLGCSLLLAAAPMSTSSAMGKAQMGLVLQRTTTGPSWFELTLIVGYDAKGGEGLLATMGGTVRHGRYENALPGFVSTFGYDDNRTASVRGQHRSACNLVGVCFNQTALDSVGFSSTRYSDKGAAGGLNTWFGVAQGKSVQYTFRGKGWALKRLPLTYRFANGSDSQIAAHAPVLTALEVYTEPIRLAGGRFGSLATAAPPCSETSVSVPRGYAKLKLTGGIRDQAVLCSGEASNVEKTGWAPRQTTWELSGTAVGDAKLTETRLLVLDLPDPRTGGLLRF